MKILVFLCTFIAIFPSHSITYNQHDKNSEKKNFLTNVILGLKYTYIHTFRYIYQQGVCDACVYTSRKTNHVLYWSNYHKVIDHEGIPKMDGVFWN